MRVKVSAALTPVAQDILVTGHDRAEIGFLIFSSVPGWRKLAGVADDAPAAGVLEPTTVRATLRNGMQTMKADRGGSPTYGARALLMEESPHIDAGKIIDKGYINQRAVLTRRAGLVEALHSEKPVCGILRMAG